MRWWMGWLICGAVACGGDSSGGGDAPDAASDPSIDAAPADARRPSGQCVANPGPVPGRHQYIVDRYVMPTNSTEAQQLGLDIDGDPVGQVDNAIGNVLSALALAGGSGVEPQVDLDAAFARGELIELLELSASDLSTASGVDLRLVQGLDCESPPDPADNFSGTEAFAIRTDAALDSIVSGAIAGGAFALGAGQLTIEVVWFGGQARLPLTRYPPRIAPPSATSVVTTPM